MLRSFFFLVLFAAAAVASPVEAGCIGSGSLQTCFDDEGNSYTVHRFGNNTLMNGSNARTGSIWSHHSTTLGSTTFHNGEANGNSWHMTDQRIGGLRIYSGIDSQGNSFSQTCNQFGSF